ncbi:MAG: hypothetical protein KF915_16645 [Polyangiaceae bacterium]|nr:hypothetical protein [Polyangiaceae bacterium]
MTPHATRRSVHSFPALSLAATLLLASFGALTACGPPNPANSGNLTDDTAIGKNRCADAATGQLRPFIVEWDATDLAGFEAKAARDLVFVKYEGCSLTVLEGCSDAGIPGRYGTYQPPVFTSGTLESFEIATEDELYAKLPLGVASFGGRLSMGEQLKLSYYVTGTRNAARESVSAETLAQNPKCAQATHFVSSYHLGAFELDSREQRAAEAEVGVGKVGGGGSSKRSEKNLKKGGELSDCQTQSQRACRVPIRVVLQPLGGGAGEVAGVAGPPVSAPADETPEGAARALRAGARQKRDRADGPGCLEDLDRADRLDPHNAHQEGYTRALCEMQAGQCEAGKRRLRDVLAAQDTGRQKSDAELDQQVKILGDSQCLSSEGTPEERINRALAAVGAASARGDTARCVAEGESIAKLIPSLPMPKHLPPRATANVVLMHTANCLLAAKQCDGARTWFDRYYEAQFKGTMSDAEYAKLAKQQSDQFVSRCTP